LARTLTVGKLLAPTRVTTHGTSMGLRSSGSFVASLRQSSPDIACLFMSPKSTHLEPAISRWEWWRPAGHVGCTAPPLRSFGRLSSLVGRSQKLLDDDLSFLDRWWTVHLTEISVQGPLRERRCRATTYRVQLPLACCIAETYTGSFTLGPVVVYRSTNTSPP
jgi:hypothetical protein